MSSFIAHIWALDQTYAQFLAMPDSASFTAPLYATERRISVAKLPVHRVAGDVAVVAIFGLLTQRGSWGSPGLQQIASALGKLVKDPSVSAILCEIDSPGGSVYGVGELADEIYQARKTKPIVGIANSLAASAAYWIGSQCSEFYVTPGGEVGSIGVFATHVDHSGAMRKAGIKPTLISAGKFKAEDNPHEPLSHDAKAFLQSRVDDCYSAFSKAVARGRAVPLTAVRDGMGQGRLLGAEAAARQRLVDGVMTFDQVLRRLAGRRLTALTRSASTYSPPSRLALHRQALELLGARPQ